MPTPPPSPVSFQCRLCTLGTWRDKGGNPMRKRPRQHVIFMYEPVEQMHCEKWKFSTTRIFIILAFNIVFKCVQISIYLNIAILFNLLCPTQHTVWKPPPPPPPPLNGNSVLHNWMFPTDCSTTVAQIPKFIQNMRTIKLTKKCGIGNWKLQNWDFSTVGQDLPYNLDILEGAEKWWDSSACI
jgi:hypothetical protein